MKSELELLKEANDILRSVNSIIERKGKATNWEGIDKKVKITLDEQHELLLVKNCYMTDVSGSLPLNYGQKLINEMEKPTIVERFSDNGEHSHYALIETETGELLWSEAPEEEIQQVKNLNIPALINRRELLVAFMKWLEPHNIKVFPNDETIFIDEFLNNQ